MIIPVHSDQRDYDIILERGALSKAGEYLNLDRKVLVVTDSGVPAQYSEEVASQCKTAVKVCIEQGEASKNFDNFRVLLSEMLKAGFSRGDCVVAVGGGVVGDMSAFSAACYMRGIDFYNIPTTLLSQVDSSIGGKTAIDFEGVKNIVGAFWQPCRVIIDPDTLKTLDDRQVRAGFVEAVKMAATNEKELFEMIENSTDFEADLTQFIYRALLIKKDVVEQDPREKGLRKVLNFGHTVGHAIESFEGGALYHGECVALGMLPMSFGEANARIKAVFRKYGIVSEITQPAEKLMPYLLHDKKKTATAINTVQVNEIGSFSFVAMQPEEIRSLLEK